jgi:hypothetical protein
LQYFDLFPAVFLLLTYYLPAATAYSLLPILFFVNSRFFFSFRKRLFLSSPGMMLTFALYIWRYGFCILSFTAFFFSTF